MQLQNLSQKWFIGSKRFHLFLTVRPFLKRTKLWLILFAWLSFCFVIYISVFRSFVNNLVIAGWDEKQTRFQQSKIKCLLKDNITNQPRPIISIQKLQTPPYLSNFKNPCWWKSGENSTLLCVPYFFLAGFPKSGTTDLYTRLLVHPLIANAMYKEPHYLTRGMFSPRSMCVMQDNDSHNCYIEQYAETFFMKTAQNILKNTNDNKKFTGLDYDEEMKTIKRDAEMKFTHPMITMDGSASTAWDSHNWQMIVENQNCSLPAYLISDMIVKVIPNVRLIMLLREPVDRAHSDYVYFSSNASSTDFHHKILHFLHHFQNCLRSYSPEECAHVKQAKDFETRARLDIGLYYVYVSEWLQRVPRDRLLILRTEDYGNNVTATLQKVFHFLQLPQLSQRALHEAEAVLRANQNKARREKIPMLPESRRLLTEFYEPYNKKLAELLDDDQFTWHDVLQH